MAAGAAATGQEGTGGGGVGGLQPHFAPLLEVIWGL